MKVLFGALVLFHIPNLDSHPEYLALQVQTESSDDYEALPGDGEVCPERHVGTLNCKFISVIRMHDFVSLIYSLSLSLCLG